MGRARWRAALEVTANLAIIGVLSYAFYAMWSTRHARGLGVGAENTGTVAGTANSAKLKALSADLGGGAQGRVVLVAMSPTCVYCREDLPLFGRLAEASRKGGKFRLVVATPEGVPEAVELLKSAGVDASYVHRVSFAKFGIQRIPIVAVLEASGKVSHVWTGLISGAKERDVMRAISPAL